MSIDKIRTLLKEELQLEVQKDILSKECQDLNVIYQTMVKELEELNQTFQKNIKIKNGISDYRTWKSEIQSHEELLFKVRNEMYSLESESIDNYLKNNLPKGIKITQQMKLRQIEKFKQKNTETNGMIEVIEKDISRVVALIIKQKEFFDYEMEIRLLEERGMFSECAQSIYKNPLIYLETLYSNSINDLKIKINEKRKDITPIETKKINIEGQLSTITEQFNTFDNIIEKAYDYNLLSIVDENGLIKIYFTEATKKKKKNSKKRDLLDILNFNENYNLLQLECNSIMIEKDNNLIKS